MPHLLCLDLDGTLIDSAPDIDACLNAVLVAHGLAPFALDAVKRMIGDGARVLLGRAFALRGRALDGAALDAVVHEFLGLYEADPVARTHLFPGVEDTLATLAGAGWRFAVVTNKPVVAARLILDRLGVQDRFALVAGGDSFAMRKPDPGHVLGALAALDATPDQAVMVGDHHNDIAAANGAGVRAIFAGYGYGERPAGDYAVIDAFSQLRALLSPA